MRHGSGRLASSILFLAAMWFAVPAYAYDQWDRLILKATIAISKMDFAGAADIYTEALSLRSDPKSEAEVLSSRALAFSLAGKAAQAEADYTAAIGLVGETDPRAYERRGYFYYGTNRFEASLADYTAGARLFPGNGTFRNGQGLALSALGKHDDAIPLFDVAIRLEPASGVFVLGRAEAYNRSRRPQQALDDYKKALELGRLTQRDTIKLRGGRGYAYLRLNDYRAAIEDFNWVLELKPDFVNPLKWRGLCYERLGDVDRALSDYGAALKLKPSDDVVAKRMQELRDRK